MCDFPACAHCLKFLLYKVKEILDIVWNTEVLQSAIFLFYLYFTVAMHSVILYM